MSNSNQAPGEFVLAHAESWNHSSISVRCPGCDEIHRHGFIDNYTEKHQRVSHCSQDCEYEIIFPFSQVPDDVGYEIDKQRVLFVAGRAEPFESLSGQENRQLATPSMQNLRNLPRWKEAIEREEVPGSPGDFVNCIDLVLQAMVLGDIEYVRHYLDNSVESNIFLHGIQVYNCRGRSDSPCDDTASDSDSSDVQHVYGSGRTALHLAACEQYPQMVELLLQRGADPNIPDLDGRVPLTEAALWGRLENVKLLLKHGADKEWKCIRDGRELRAVDFAKSLRANARERYVRSGSEHYIYQEKTYERDLDRKAIVRLLRNGLEKSSQDQHRLGGFAFTKSLNGKNLLTLVAHFDILQKSKTIGVLHRGNQFRPVAAMSGWTHQEGRNMNIQIGGRDWTAEVRRLCKHIRYDLATHKYDQGDPGRYHACHAEKQLIAYFVNKHMFLEFHVTKSVDMGRLGLDEISEVDYELLEKVREHKERLKNLERVKPSVSLKKASILVCRPVCDDCKDFVKQINFALDLEITVYHHCLELDCRTCKR